MIIVGTAGHIDHGKTTLIGSLTGIRTDRLKEEQDRGISIELGFAYLDLPGGGRCGIVDVPGHERFVRQMIAGATGIDLLMLVIAADEGVMQQTREHLDICRLLGIKNGMVILTKVDLVDDEWLELVESDLEDYLEGSFLEGAPVLRFASTQPATAEPIKAALAQHATRIEASGVGASRAGHPLRLPIDRVFTMKGFGTVVTGTLASGRLGSGDRITILPGGRQARVRGLQSHGEAVDAVDSGQRTAINLQGIDKDLVHRGEVVTHQGELLPTRMLDMDLHLLAHISRPLTSQAKALVHVGTTQVNGTIVLLDREQLHPGDTAPVQLRLDDYVVALGGDAVVLRGFELLESYGKTLGGGLIRHPLPRRSRKGQTGRLEALEALRGDDMTARIEYAARLSGQAGVPLSAVRQIVMASKPEVAEVADQLVAAGKCQKWLEDGQTHLIHKEAFDELTGRATRALAEYHNRFAHRLGMPREELRSQIRAELPARLYAVVVDRLKTAGQLDDVDGAMRAGGFEPTLSVELKSLRDEILGRLQRARLEPPLIQELEAELAERKIAKQTLKEILDLLVVEGHIRRLSSRLCFASEHLDRLEREVVTFLKANGEMTTPQLKEITGASRKYTVPIGEHLDAALITLRAGDVRKLRL